MAKNTESAQILKVALPPAFYNWQNMIGIPQRFALEPLEAPLREQLQPGGTARPAQLPISGASVDSAKRADAAVPDQNLLAKIPRVGAEAPFIYTPIRTECETALRNFETTPAAEVPAIRSLRQCGAIDKAARNCARSARKGHNIVRINCFGRFR